MRGHRADVLRTGLVPMDPALAPCEGLRILSEGELSRTTFPIDQKVGLLR